jgi:hypothetical protein
MDKAAERVCEYEVMRAINYSHETLNHKYRNVSIIN